MVPDRGGRALEGGGGAIDNAEVAVTIDQSHGSELLAQRVIRCTPGRSHAQSRGHAGDPVRRVRARHPSRGRRAHPLEPDIGAYVVSGEEYELDNPGPDDLVVVVVEAPQEDGMANPPSAAPSATPTSRRSRRVTTASSATSPTRMSGCRDLTQFLGLIAPSRAPNHSHIYDEIIYVVDGEGTSISTASETMSARGRQSTCRR